MAKKRKSDKRVEKEREDGHKRIEDKIIKKEEKKLEEGMVARQVALNDLGIKREYNFADHQGIYAYSNDREGAPIKTIGDKIAKCKRCYLLKDGNLPKEQQCKCDWDARGWQSPPPSPPHPPKPLRKRASPYPAMQESVPYVSGNRRAAKVFEKSMEAAGK